MRLRITADLHDALKSCSDIERDIVALGTRMDIQRKFDLVQHRRRFAEKIGELSGLIDREEALAGDPDKRKEMGRLFTAFRYAIGQHQASWPAVRIGEDLVAYAASARNTHIKSGDFWAWCTQNLTFERA